MYNFAFELTGTMPLIMNFANIEAGDILKEWQRDSENADLSVAGDDRTPPWSWQSRLYHDGKFVAMPSELLMASLREAGKQMKIKGNKTFKKASQGGILIYSEFLDFFCNGEQVSIDGIDFFDSSAKNDKTGKFVDQIKLAKSKGFSLFIKRAKPAGMGGGRHIRVRPRFDVWSVVGKGQVVTAFEDVLTNDKLKELFKIAGNQSGLGDWRPSAPNSPGQFGMFEANIVF